jgi:hypothetical protein
VKTECRVRECRNQRYGRLSLCQDHHREKKRRNISKAWSRRVASGSRRLTSSTASSLKLEALTHYGDSCVGCGETAPGELQLDHVHTNGHQHRLLISKGRAGADFYRALKKKGWPNKEPYIMEVVCYDCHLTRTQARRYDNV